MQELTGVAIPKYYKPAAVNPLKYADQLKKRKLLWNKDKQQTAEVSGSHVAMYDLLDFSRGVNIFRVGVVII